MTAHINRFRRLAMAGALATALLGGSAASVTLADDHQPAAAQEAPRPLTRHTHQLHGTVKAINSATTFTVTTRAHGDVLVTFAGAKLPGAAREHGKREGGKHGKHGKPRSFQVASTADLKAGERVVVLGKASADDKTFIARAVHVLPTIVKPTHAVGTVASVVTAGGATTLTVTLSDGTSASYKVTDDTRLRPDDTTLASLTVGTKVTVVAKGGTATAIVVHKAA